MQWAKQAGVLAALLAACACGQVASDKSVLPASQREESRLRSERAVQDFRRLAEANSELLARERRIIEEAERRIATAEERPSMAGPCPPGSRCPAGALLGRLGKAAPLPDATLELRRETARELSSVRSRATEIYSTEIVAEIRRNLQLGAIAFNVPEAMPLDRKETIVFILSDDLPVEALEKRVREELTLPSGDAPDTKALAGIVAERVKIANVMTAQLAGAGFQITPGTPERQAITSGSPAKWYWEVKPKSGGVHSLILSLHAHVSVNGSNTPLVIQTYRREIRVLVGAWERSVHWLKETKEIIAALTVVLGALLGAWRFLRRRPVPAAAAGDDELQSAK